MKYFCMFFRQIDVFTKQKLRFDEFFYTNFTIRKKSQNSRRFVYKQNQWYQKHPKNSQKILKNHHKSPSNMKCYFPSILNSFVNPIMDLTISALLDQ